MKPSEKLRGILADLPAETHDVIEVSESELVGVLEQVERLEQAVEAAEIARHWSGIRENQEKAADAAEAALTAILAFVPGVRKQHAWSKATEGSKAIGALIAWARRVPFARTDARMLRHAVDTLRRRILRSRDLGREALLGIVNRSTRAVHQIDDGTTPSPELANATVEALSRLRQAEAYEEILAILDGINVSD